MGQKTQNDEMNKQLRIIMNHSHFYRILNPSETVRNPYNEIRRIVSPGVHILSLM